MGKREDIIEATKVLLWEKGYEATSPRDIQDRSHAGQGSFYHHFSSKQALARVAIDEMVDERIADFEAAMGRPGGFGERLISYLAQNKRPMLGCRIGRLVWDAAIESDELREPMNRYFKHLEKRLIQILKAEQADGRIKLKMPAEQIALLIIASVQGGFAVSRAMKTSRTADLRVALQSLLALALNT
ncbi:TetR family transcriptional regulator [Trinickia symbiotica]|uniref:TetR family transcriptional regulator n=1 Tax=Trinickia symbiotica TaxID=863227 RepID=A0A2T3XU61_9BURK|nr:TetR/AcrR family transcriptional regulator [Trinickia symbiotica]PTB20027.1 TetR family transcriptional regulator [Trinickia symbiotica]